VYVCTYIHQFAGSCRSSFLSLVRDRHPQLILVLLEDTWPAKWSEWRSRRERERKCLYWSNSFNKSLSVL